MPDDYAYPIAQCDVTTEKRAALESYRGKRHLWLSWIYTDEHHAIWRVLSSMVWTDVSFKVSGARTAAAKCSPLDCYNRCHPPTSSNASVVWGKDTDPTKDTSTTLDGR